VGNAEIRASGFQRNTIAIPSLKQQTFQPAGHENQFQSTSQKQGR
jgi:hypothetical protein